MRNQTASALQKNSIKINDLTAIFHIKVYSDLAGWFNGLSIYNRKYVYREVQKTLPG
jgi:hypothetical protein